MKVIKERIHFGKGRKKEWIGGRELIGKEEVDKHPLWEGKSCRGEEVHWSLSDKMLIIDKAQLDWIWQSLGKL